MLVENQKHFVLRFVVAADLPLTFFSSSFGVASVVRGGTEKKMTFVEMGKLLGVGGRRWGARAPVLWSGSEMRRNYLNHCCTSLYVFRGIFKWIPTVFFSYSRSPHTCPTMELV